MKLSLFFLFSFITFHTINAQNYDWGKKWGYNGGTTDLVFAMDIASDNLGNSYVLSFGDTQVDFDPTAGTLMGPTVACGAISKFDSDGNLVWVKFISRISGGTPVCTPEAIYLSNNILYIAGEFQGVYDFNPGAGTNSFGAATSRVFTLQLDLNGNYITAGVYLDRYCYVSDISTDSNDNIYITGSFGENSGINVSHGSSTLINSGSYDAFLAKISNTGAAEWAVGYGSTGEEKGTSLGVKSNGNVLFSGYFSGNVDFDPTTGTNMLQSNNASRDFFLQELNTSGVVLNTITGGGIDSDAFNSLFVDDFDNIFIGGYLNGFVDLDPSMNTNMIGGSGQVGLVAKYNSSLNFLWGSVFENQSVPTSSNSVLDLLVDQSSNIYLSGRFGGTIDLNTNLSQSQFITAGGATSNSFFTKLNSNGQSVWSGGFIGVTDGYNVPNGIAYGNGGLYIAGEFKSTVDFDPSINTSNFTSAYSSSGVVPKETAYLVKLTTCTPTTSMISPESCGPYTSPDGAVYSTAGNYIAVIPNSNGCDSTISINLTINSNSSSTINEISCNNYTAPDGQIYSQSGVYSAVVANSEGCDSIITINLTINQNTSNSLTETACKTYTAPDGQIYTQNGNYSAIIPNTAGCDSLITIDLTIYNVNTAVSSNGTTITAAANGLQYQWINCANEQPIVGAVSQSYSPTVNGDYAVIVIDGACSDTSDCISITSVGISETKLVILKIYPNPASSNFSIESSELVEYSMYDLSGNLINYSAMSNNKHLIEVSIYSNGAYFIQVVGENVIETFKVIVLHE